jgi:hypothetical protein
MTPAKNEPGTLRERIAPFRAKGSGGCLAGNVATFAPRSHLVPRSLTIRREAESNFLQHLGWGVAKNADQKNQYLTLDACAQLAQKPIIRRTFPIMITVHFRSYQVVSHTGISRTACHKSCNASAPFGDAAAAGQIPRTTTTCKTVKRQAQRCERKQDDSCKRL